ncbi:hypothetical protein [Paraburkholderia sp. BCC1876]|uniref:hypothetical protein n=1 Tax=Paraburkholderia sp. BCC1876 TaxID=2676303 RepID=UPI0015920D07|nr:hypothetical protein [Paraburkholderia sp. BCC1876]
MSLDNRGLHFTLGQSGYWRTASFRLIHLNPMQIRIRPHMRRIVVFSRNPTVFIPQ